MNQTAKKGSDAPPLSNPRSKYRALKSGNVDAHDQVKAYELKEGEEVQPCECHAADMLAEGIIEKVEVEK